MSTERRGIDRQRLHGPPSTARHGPGCHRSRWLLRSLVATVATVAALSLPPAAPAEGLRPDPLATMRDGPLEVASGETVGSAIPVAAAPSADASRRARERARWTWPLSPRPVLLAPFVRPRSDFGPGHRGIDLEADAGAAVLAVDDGEVLFAGVIAGKPTLAIGHAGGLRSTYEPVRATVRVGAQVAAGQGVGVVVPGGSHCGDACIHLGAIGGGTYLDPLLLLRARRVRLLPLH